jgi:hypothetical protein
MALRQCEANSAETPIVGDGVKFRHLSKSLQRCGPAYAKGGVLNRHFAVRWPSLSTRTLAEGRIQASSGPNLSS